MCLWVNISGKFIIIYIRVHLEPNVIRTEWRRSQLNARARSSLARSRCGETPRCWSTAAPPCPLYPGPRRASWASPAYTASSSTSSRPSCCPCCSSLKLAVDGTSALSPDVCSLPEVSSAACSPTCSSGLSCTGWCTCTEKQHYSRCALVHSWRNLCRAGFCSFCSRHD